MKRQTPNFFSKLIKCKIPVLKVQYRCKWGDIKTLSLPKNMSWCSYDEAKFIQSSKIDQRKEIRDQIKSRRGLNKSTFSQRSITFRDKKQNKTETLKSIVKTQAYIKKTNSQEERSLTWLSIVIFQISLPRCAQCCKSHPGTFLKAPIQIQEAALLKNQLWQQSEQIVSRRENSSYC